MKRRLKCLIRRHNWVTIINGGLSGGLDTQRCQRCGHYRTHRPSDHERVVKMT